MLHLQTVDGVVAGKDRYPSRRSNRRNSRRSRDRKNSPFQRNIWDAIVIGVAVDGGLPVTERRQWKPMKADLDGTAAQARIKSDRVCTGCIIGGNDRLAQ